MAFFKSKKNKSILADQRLWMAITGVLVIGFIVYAVYEYFPMIKVGENLQNGTQQQLIDVPVTIVLNPQDKNQTENMELFLQKISNPENGIKGVKINSKLVDYSQEEGKKLIKDLNLLYLPQVLFGKEFEQTEDFAKSKEVFEQKGNYAVINLPMLQLPPMQYLQYPSLDARDGNSQNLKPEQKQLVIVEYASPTCVHCANVADSLKKALKEYGDKVALIERHYDRGGRDLQLENALECSGVQGKFGALSDAFYKSQTELSDAVMKATTPEEQGVVIAKYIVKKAKAVGISGAGDVKTDFQKCVDSMAYTSTVQNDTKEANVFGVYGTPGLFIGSQYLLAWSDKLVELKTICFCGRKASMVLRLDQAGRPYNEGEQVVIGGNERYVSVCRKHYKEALQVGSLTAIQERHRHD